MNKKGNFEGIYYLYIIDELLNEDNMSDFFAKLTGFDPKYAEQNAGKNIDETEDDFDYSGVDFCQGDIDTNTVDEGIFAAKYDAELRFDEDNDYDDYTGFDTEC